MGVFEAAFLPCAIFYCSLFYTRRELGFRTAIFYQMGVIAVWIILILPSLYFR